jgi:S-adenosylmethionine decarboxylase
MFGPHLTLDLYNCNKEKLLDLDFVYKILDELPDMIDMHKMCPPQVIIQNPNPDTFDKGGISGFVLIAESHISIHTFVAQEYASIDIFSCKKFDFQKAVNYLIDKFEAQKAEKNLFSRGKEFPKDVELAKAIVLKTRKV